MCCVHGNAQGAGCAVGSQNRASAYSDMFHIEQKEELCRRSFVSKLHHYEEEERQCFWRDGTFADLILRTKKIQCAKTEEDY